MLSVKAETCADGLQKNEYIFHTAAGTPMPPNDYGIVAVIDGSKKLSPLFNVVADVFLESLNLTPLRIANVPPPMALNQISLTFNAIDVVVANPRDGRTDAHIAVLGVTELSLYKWHMVEKSTQAPSFCTSQVISGVEESEHPQGQPDLANQQIVFLGSDLLLLLQSCAAGNRILTYSFNNDTLMLINSIERPAIQYIITSLSELDSELYLCDTDGQVTHVPIILNSTSKTDARLKPITKFPKSVRKIELVQLHTKTLSLKDDTQVEHLPQRSVITFGLTLHGSLFADQHCLAKDCTSFLLTPAHLIYTTAQHLLKFVHLTQVSGAFVEPDIRSYAETSIRS